MVPANIHIGLPDDIIAQVDEHLHLYGSFSSRRELVAFAVLDFLDRLESTGYYCS